MPEPQITPTDADYFLDWMNGIDKEICHEAIEAHEKRGIEFGFFDIGTTDYADERRFCTGQKTAEGRGLFSVPIDSQA